MTSDNRVIYLKISTWRGMSIGAEHYYGHLTGYDPEYKSVELTHKLTKAQADNLNKQRGDDYVYRAGYEINGFDTQGAVKRFAAKHYLEHFPNAKIVLLGNGAYVEPHLALIAPDWFKKISKKMHDQCEKLGGYSSGNDDLVDAITDKWEQELSRAIKELG